LSGESLTGQCVRFSLAASGVALLASFPLRPVSPPSHRWRARAVHPARRIDGELKILMPEDAKEAFGHGIRAKRSKSGAISFDLLDVEANYAPVQ
jgi:hypothetical protein